MVAQVARDDRVDMSLVCSKCGDEVLVRTKKYQARCLSCLHKFSVETGQWKGLPESRKHHSGHTIWDSIAISAWSKVSTPKCLAVFLLVVAVPVIAVWFVPMFLSLHWAMIAFMLAGWTVTLLAVFGWLQDLGKPVKQISTHCAYCGYDMRGSGVICPECGHRGRHGKQTAQPETQTT